MNDAANRATALATRKRRARNPKAARDALRLWHAKHPGAGRAYQRKHMAAHPEACKARKTASNALRDGRIVRQACETCDGTRNIEMHHDDYSKPLEVRWLCMKCHKCLHRKHKCSGSGRS